MSFTVPKTPFWNINVRNGTRHHRGVFVTVISTYFPFWIQWSLMVEDEIIFYLINNTTYYNIVIVVDLFAPCWGLLRLRISTTLRDPEEDDTYWRVRERDRQRQRDEHPDSRGQRVGLPAPASGDAVHDPVLHVWDAGRPEHCEYVPELLGDQGWHHGGHLQTTDRPPLPGLRPLPTAAVDAGETRIKGADGTSSPQDSWAEEGQADRRKLHMDGASQ